MKSIACCVKVADGLKDRDRWKKLDISERTFYDRIERAHAIIDNAYEALRVNDRGLEINA